MKKTAILFLASLFFLDANGQHNSEDYKDAVGCGPFPLYLTIGGATSRHKDFREIGSRFTSVYGDRTKRYIRGVEASFGSPIIGKRRQIRILPSFLSFALEGKYLMLQRQIVNDDNKFEMASHQLSIGGGVRYPVFPIVIQVQYQRILFSKQSYKLRLDGDERLFDITSQGNLLLARFSFLDPAGSDGGFGVFAEYGLCHLERRKENNQLTPVIQAINSQSAETLNAARSYRFFSVGIIVPLALRIQ